MNALLKLKYLILFFAGLSQGLAAQYPVVTYNAQEDSPIEVLDKWMALQIQMMGSTTASFNGPFVRIYSYSGLVAYESIAPGIADNSPYVFSSAAFNQLPELPEIEQTENFHWPSSLNAALAFINRAMFRNTHPLQLMTMDSLEHAFRLKFRSQADEETLKRSREYGTRVAQLLFDWSETDGYLQASNPYLAPAGPGKWVPTAPNFARASTPHWGDLRTMIEGSIINTQPVAPPAYSEDTASAFYKMVHEVYMAHQHLSPEQKEMVLFWRDINPGITAPGHWLNIMRQLFELERSTISLEKAVFAYAYSGIALNDAWISCWKTRYEYNLVRPITYIRKVMALENWIPLLVTPPHPEYTSGFACMAGAVSHALVKVFGESYPFTDHTYDDLGMAPRSFKSLQHLAREAADSKFYGGIHYKLSVDEGLKQGIRVSQNIETLLLSDNDVVPLRVYNKSRPN